MLSLTQSPYFWLSLGLLLIVLELLIPGVYLLWIGLGALLVALPTFLFDQLPLAITLLCLVLSVGAAVWIGLELQRRAQKGPAQVNLGLDAYIGQQVQVVAVNAQNPHELRISLAGTTYPAYCAKSVHINDQVIIKAIQSGRFIVAPQTDKQNYS